MTRRMKLYALAFFLSFALPLLAGTYNIRTSNRSSSAATSGRGSHNNSDQESGRSSGKISGTFITASFDFDHADLSTPANVTTFTGSDSRFGGIAGQYLGEFVPAPNGAACTPPSGVAGAGKEFNLLAETGVVTRLKTGDQLSFAATSGKQCIVFSSLTPPFPFNLGKIDSITGGTGEFAGATGTLTTEGTGAILSIDASTHRVFGWVQITYEANIKLPEGDHSTSSQ